MNVPSPHRPERSGHCTRTPTTTAGDVELCIPKLRAGSVYPSLLERRRRIDQTLFAEVMEHRRVGRHGNRPNPVATRFRARGAFLRRACGQRSAAGGTDGELLVVRPAGLEPAAKCLEAVKA